MMELPKQSWNVELMFPLPAARHVLDVDAREDTLPWLGAEKHGRSLHFGRRTRGSTHRRRVTQENLLHSLLL